LLVGVLVVLTCAVAQAAPGKTEASALGLGAALLAAPRAAVHASILHARQSERYPELPLGKTSLPLLAGRSLVRVELPPGRFVTVGVLGPPEALLCFDLLPQGLGARLRAHAPLEHDGRLPAFYSFQAPSEPGDVVVVVDAEAPVRLSRVAVDPAAIEAPSLRDLRTGEAEARPLIGLPFPLEPRDGYVLLAPHRYQFLRVDVAVALRAALHQTHIRYRRGALAIGDGTQWDGRRPAADLDEVRHISHAEGRDVDIALPSDDDDKTASSFERRCRGVMVDEDELECAPGTARGVDAARLAYFLGLLLDGPTPNGRHMPENRPGPIAVVETIYTDQEYVILIRRAAEKLRRRRWIHDEGYTALGPDGVLKASPWHLDHVHIRFVGEPAAAIRWQ